MQVVMSIVFLFGLFFGPEVEKKPFVVVELFTSEGCSSCPPADQLLSEIVDATNEDVEVIGLSFHVDYWDYIGWKDPYASKDFTRRQRTYARKFYSSQIYTPQMVVNGKHEFVGSSRSRWKSVFSEVKTQSNDYEIEISSATISNGKLLTTISSNDTKNVILNVAVVERGLSQNVTRGENRGRKLAHDNVVRAFEARQFEGNENRFEIELPRDLKVENSSIVVYVQDEKTWEVLSAESSNLK